MAEVAGVISRGIAAAELRILHERTSSFRGVGMGGGAKDDRGLLSLVPRAGVADGSLASSTLSQRAAPTKHIESNRTSKQSSEKTSDLPPRLSPLPAGLETFLLKAKRPDYRGANESPNKRRKMAAVMFPKRLDKPNEITGPAYRDRAHASPPKELLTQAQQAAEYNKQINWQRNRSPEYLDRRWGQPHQAPPSNAAPEVPSECIERICISYTISEDLSGDRGSKILSRISEKKRDSCEVRLRERSSYGDRWSLKHRREAVGDDNVALDRFDDSSFKHGKALDYPEVPAPMKGGGADVTKAYNQLQINERAHNIPDETILAYYHALSNGAPTDSKDTYTKALRVIAIDRHSQFLLRKLGGPNASTSGDSPQLSSASGVSSSPRSIPEPVSPSAQFGPVFNNSSHSNANSSITVNPVTPWPPRVSLSSNRYNVMRNERGTANGSTGSDPYPAHDYPPGPSLPPPGYSLPPPTARYPGPSSPPLPPSGHSHPPPPKYHPSPPAGYWSRSKPGPSVEDTLLLLSDRSASDLFRKSEREHDSRKRTISVGDGDRLVNRTTTTTYHPQARSRPKGFPELKSEATMRERLLKEAQRISGLPIPTGIGGGRKRSRDEDDGVPIFVPRSRPPPPGLDLGWERQRQSSLHPGRLKRGIVKVV